MRDIVLENKVLKHSAQTCVIKRNLNSGITAIFEGPVASRKRLK